MGHPWSGMCRGLVPLESLELLAWSLLVASRQELGWLWGAVSCPEDRPWPCSRLGVSWAGQPRGRGNVLDLKWD